MTAAFDAAEARGPLRILVHCAGRGGAVRLVDRDGLPGSLELYSEVVTINLIGTFNVLRLAAACMARNEPLDGDRGVCVLTASVAAFEGQIGQIPYASAKAGIHGMTIVAARDLAGKGIRVCTIAPGTFDTPLLARLSDDVRNSLANNVPHPKRLGYPDEYAKLAMHIIDNAMLNGETIRLDGAIRMAPDEFASPPRSQSTRQGAPSCLNSHQTSASCKAWPRPWRINVTGRTLRLGDRDKTHLPAAERRLLADLDLLALTLPEEYGGGGRPLARRAGRDRGTGKGKPVAAWPVFEASTGPARVMHLFGTDEQRHEYLPSVAAGESPSRCQSPSPTPGRQLPTPREPRVSTATKS